MNNDEAANVSINNQLYLKFAHKINVFLTLVFKYLRYNRDEWTNSDF